MKLWEAIKEITENPKKVFELQERYKTWTLKTDYDGKHPDETTLYFLLECVGDDSVGESGGFSGNLTTNCSGWQEVQQPVPWQEAIQAWANGGNIKWVSPDSERVSRYCQSHLNDRLGIAMHNHQVTTGTWYIEEDDK